MATGEDDVLDRYRRYLLSEQLKRWHLIVYGESFEVDGQVVSPERVHSMAIHHDDYESYTRPPRARSFGRAWTPHGHLREETQLRFYVDGLSPRGTWGASIEFRQGHDLYRVREEVRRTLYEAGRVMFNEMPDRRFKIDIEVTSAGRRSGLSFEVEQGGDAEHFANYVRQVVLGMF